jgi:hypothetical protein
MFPTSELVAALLSLVVGTLFGSELTRWLYRPNVIIRYKDIDPLYADDGVHWSIKVANLGRTVASDCKSVITIQGLLRDDLLEAHEANPTENLPEYKDENIAFPRPQQIGRKYFRPIVSECLAWAALGNPASISINPGLTQILDVFKVQGPDKGGYITLPSESGWRKVRARIKARELSGHIFICPSNEFPTLIMFTLAFDDEGRSRFIVTQPSWKKRLERFFFRQRYYFG